jgi:phospholipase C
MTDRRLMGHFADMDEFQDDVTDRDFGSSYVFIEPDYGRDIASPGDFVCGNSQHPLDDITRGEQLIKTVYETIRNSPHWNDSVLVITYDEQGGFYDHAIPPPATPPGDPITDDGNNHHNFDFAQLGVRVPAVIVSPLIPRGTIDHTIYDHSSVLASARRIFGFGALTERDRRANDFLHLLSLSTPRTDAPTQLAAPARSGFVCEDDPMGPSARRVGGSSDTGLAGEAWGPIESSHRGFLHVAFLRDYHSAGWVERHRIAERFLRIQTRGQASAYIASVRQRVEVLDERLRNRRKHKTRTK